MSGGLATLLLPGVPRILGRCEVAGAVAPGHHEVIGGRRALLLRVPAAAARRAQAPRPSAGGALRHRRWRLPARLAWVGSVPTDRIYQGIGTTFDSITWGCLLSTLLHRERLGRGSHPLELLPTRIALFIGFALPLATLSLRDPVFG